MTTLRPHAAAAGVTADATRLIAFGDAFFPIVLTLLVIEIHKPDAAPGGLAQALAAAWASYAAFALAFVYVGVIWLNHHGLFRQVARVDRGLNGINLGILGTAALIPFPTGVLAEALQSGNTADQRAAVVLYGVFAALMSAAWAPIFPYLERHRERLAPAVPGGYFRAQRSRPWFGAAAYGLAIVAGTIGSPWLAVVIFLLIVLYHAWTSEGFGTWA
ncbi:TMEM175 family protein [Allosphingosinicella deserti]|uniref:TMEM175 family protein n=1 Tax=Allosphingosinicella deserti TaxID=2116704 RepID=UPI001304CBA9|nr:TMEM175 family protein [Sphingomonas deserti]